MDWRADGAVRIGAFTTVAAIAADSRIARGWPALAAAAQGLATPQIRHLATLGGNLAQRSRCWYFRNPQIDCLKKGGPTCYAVEGENRLFNQYGVMLVNPEKHPHVKKELGQQFIDWLVSAEGQKAIADYKINGQQLFFPNASAPGA